MNQSVSVILPTFNGQRYIAEAIESALAQTLAPCEIIVVDDGSTDGTEKIVRSYGSRVHYIYQKNKGASGAYNTGIGSASGDYVAFLEHDDVWAPEKNENQVQFFEEDVSLGMVFSPVLLLEENTPSKRTVNNVDDGGGEVTFSDFFARNRVLNCSTVMIRKVVLEDIGGFREDLPLSFDYDLWLRIAAKYRVACLKMPLATYRIHSNNLSRDDHDLMAAMNSLKAILFWTDDPFVREQLGIDTIKKRVVELHRQIAWYCAELGQRDEETRHLWAAVKAQPLQLSNWREYLWRSLDRRTRNRLTWYGKRLFGRSRQSSTHT